MTNHKSNDDDRRLREAELELHEVRQRGKRMTPLLDRLHRHADDNAFADRLIAVIEQNVRGS
jgi:hypothetical protein